MRYEDFVKANPKLRVKTLDDFPATAKTITRYSYIEYVGGEKIEREIPQEIKTADGKVWTLGRVRSREYAGLIYNYYTCPKYQ